MFTGITPTMLRAVSEGKPIEDGTPEGIIKSEKAGQVMICEGKMLPKEIVSGHGETITWDDVCVKYPGLKITESDDGLFVLAKIT